MHEWMCSYGATGSGKLVDAAGLQLLENMGFQRALAAEALKQVTSCFITPLLQLAYLWQQGGLCNVFVSPSCCLRRLLFFSEISLLYKA